MLPISALQHLLHCPRQCALIHLEQAWADNQHTVEGNILHEKVHQEDAETRPGVRITRGLPVASEFLGMVGQCDVVEFVAVAGAIRRGRSLSPTVWSSVTPVEYKRGRPKSNDADRVQLCAQALCLEEMLGMSIPQGALYYGRPRRRTPVMFTPELRSVTVETIRQLRALLATGITPLADYLSARCQECSLLDLCLPRHKERPKQVSEWFRATINHLATSEI
ncbi:MAG: CRISPR-associated protein Cas4 [Magnetococcales bacterium]|nr:CRISPR-associated protein Cas4 [Magnetococcales bacterium]MBF0115519.1 CRISPR-associated protein Cas4 [Magnetococcales bacterium]